jgi:sugar O-acyltransferase (sialic acid O-acetyltransferase NeuD family)
MKSLNPVIIVGAKGLAKAAYESFVNNDIVVYGFLDDDKKLHNTEIGDVTVLGETDDDGFLKLIGQKCDAFVALENNKERAAVVKNLLERRKVMPINLVDKTAVVASSVELGHGNYIGQQVLVNSFTKIANHTILNSACTIEYDCVIGDYVQVGAGATVGAGVEIEEGAFIGTGVIIVPGVKIGKNARLGAGSVVIADVKAGKTVFGNPAKELEK